MAESPLAQTAESRVYYGRLLRGEPCNVERESKSGVTPLVAACYRLRPFDVALLLEKGADPNRLASFAGGVTPVLAVLLAVADAFDAGRTPAGLLGDAHCGVQIWARLSAEGGFWEFPSSVFVGRDVLRSLRNAAAREDETALFMNLVRIEERMHDE